MRIKKIALNLTILTECQRNSSLQTCDFSDTSGIIFSKFTLEYLRSFSKYFKDNFFIIFQNFLSFNSLIAAKTAFTTGPFRKTVLSYTPCDMQCTVFLTRNSTDSLSKMMSQKQTFGLPKLKKKYRRALKISENFLKLVWGTVLFW